MEKCGIGVNERRRRPRRGHSAANGCSTCGGESAPERVVIKLRSSEQFEAKKSR